MEDKSLSNNNQKIKKMMMQYTSEELNEMANYLIDNFEDLPRRDDAKTLEMVKNLCTASKIINGLTKEE